MTLSELRFLVRGITLASSPEVSDALITDHINAGLRELAALDDWPFLEASTTINLSASTQAYALPDDFGTLIEVVIGNEGEKLTETTRREAQKQYLGADEGTPEKYYLWAEEINFVPVPSANPNFDTVIVDYYRTPTLLSSDADEPEFHSAYHTILADYAISRVWEFYEDFDRSSLYYGRFRSRVMEMAWHYRNRSKNTPLIVGDESYGQEDPQRPFMTWLQPYA